MTLWTGPLTVFGTDKILSPRVKPSFVSKRLPLMGSVVILYVSGSPSLSARNKDTVISYSSIILIV